MHVEWMECYEVEAFQSSQEPQELLGFTKTQCLSCQTHQHHLADFPGH